MYHFCKNIEAISAYKPGKPVKEVERELGIKNSIKLASNENAWGFSPKSKAAMEEAIRNANIYPDGASFYLRRKISEFHNIPIDNIVVGNGSNEVLAVILRTILREGTNVVSSQHAFPVYKIMTQSCCAKFTAVPAQNYRFDVYSMMKACDENTAIIMIDNPNNPTGTYLPYNQMMDILNFAEKNKILFIADEAYIEYVRAADYKTMMNVFDKYENLVITRTFSKAYGLCGLRLGYGIGNKEIIGLAHKVRDPFNVNIIAQYAGEAALEDQDFVKRVVKNTHDGIDYLYSELKKIGLNYIETQGNFILVEVPGSGKEFFDKLLRYGIIVRPVGEDLHKHIRLTVGTMEQNKKAIDAIKEVIKG
ncbi:MAG: histidinol-phosphate transaminase [Proteobacteria bacterium]|nr:histidinol-phosphate transaminase [Pseudomonadota bacterium]